MKNETTPIIKRRTDGRTYLVVGVCLIAVPVLILANSLLGFDESGFTTTIMFIMAGVPCAVAGLIMLLIGLVRSARSNG